MVTATIRKGGLGLLLEHFRPTRPINALSLIAETDATLSQTSVTKALEGEEPDMENEGRGIKEVGYFISWPHAMDQYFERRPMAPTTSA